MLERIQKANDIKKLTAGGTAGTGTGNPTVSDRKDQQDRWTSGIKSWRGRTYDGNASGL